MAWRDGLVVAKRNMQEVSCPIHVLHWCKPAVFSAALNELLIFKTAKYNLFAELSAEAKSKLPRLFDRGFEESSGDCGVDLSLVDNQGEVVNTLHHLIASGSTADRPIASWTRVLEIPATSTDT